MTEESSNKESASPEKLLIDNPSNFQFHAAYLTYSAIYDKTSNPETKRQLNEHIMSLQQSQTDYANFYESIDQFRGGDAVQRGFGRSFIKTQKKREWRRKTQKHERIKRHRK